MPRAEHRAPGRGAWRQAVCQAAGLWLLLLVGPFVVAAFPGFSSDFLAYVEEQYGGRAQSTMKDWERLVSDSRDLAEPDKLRAANLFFNKRIWFLDDRDHWGQEDYWATPMQTMATLGGDCEDFVIAKYFTLREIGVADERLRLTYVRSTLIDKPHMVLAYYRTPGAAPLVLDNLMDEIKPAAERPDLTPVYSFNGRSLWQAKEFGRGRKIGSAGNVELWADLTQRMRREAFPY